MADTLANNLLYIFLAPFFYAAWRIYGSSYLFVDPFDLRLLFNTFGQLGESGVEWCIRACFSSSVLFSFFLFSVPVFQNAERPSTGLEYAIFEFPKYR